MGAIPWVQFRGFNSVGSIPLGSIPCGFNSVGSISLGSIPFGFNPDGTGENIIRVMIEERLQPGIDMPFPDHNNVDI